MSDRIREDGPADALTSFRWHKPEATRFSLACGLAGVRQSEVLRALAIAWTGDVFRDFNVATEGRARAITKGRKVPA